MGGQAYVHHEPLGVVLNIGAWNYPVQIPMSILSNVLAAGMSLSLSLAVFTRWIVTCVISRGGEINIHNTNL